MLIFIGAFSSLALAFFFCLAGIAEALRMCSAALLGVQRARRPAKRRVNSGWLFGWIGGSDRIGVSLFSHSTLMNSLRRTHLGLGISRGTGRYWYEWVTPGGGFLLNDADCQRIIVSVIATAPPRIMNRRLLANLAQAALLGGVFLLASRDVERTMAQTPVRPDQNAALIAYHEQRRRHQ